MEPNIRALQDLVITDPVQAYGLAYGLTRIPVAYTVRVSFSSFALNQPSISQSFANNLTQRTWIDNITYSLDQPNVFKDQVFKSQYDAFLKDHPGVDIRLTIFGGPRTALMDDFTPLENYVNRWASRWPNGWPLFNQQNIKAEFQLSSAPSSANPNAPPYNVALTLNGWQFLECSPETTTVESARKALAVMGFWVPDVPKCVAACGTMR